MGTGMPGGQLGTNTVGCTSLALISEIQECIGRLEGLLRPVRLEIPSGVDKDSNEGDLINGIKSVKARLLYLESTIRL